MNTNKGRGSWAEFRPSDLLSFPHGLMEFYSPHSSMGQFVWSVFKQGGSDKPLVSRDLFL